MNRKITELTNMARMQIGEIEVKLKPLETSRLISEIASQSEVLFQAKEQTLTLKIQGILPRVNADRSRLEEVLLNLLSNANKFSPVGSDIVLRAREVDGKMIVEVEDQAPQVTEKEKEARVEIWETVVAEEQKKGTSLKVTQYPEEALRARTQLPSQIVGSTKNYCKMAGAGISWPGTFTPANKWAPVYKDWKRILIEHKLSPSVRMSMYRGVHYGMLRAMIPFNKQNPEENENARHAIVECLKVDLDHGGIPYP